MEKNYKLSKKLPILFVIKNSHYLAENLLYCENGLVCIDGKWQDSAKVSELDIEKTEQKQNDAENQLPPPPARDQKFANKTFNWLNYFGLGFVANLMGSLFITYNVMPTDTAQKGIGKLADGIKPVAEGFGKFKKFLGFAKEIDKATHELHIKSSARSMAETIVMCISGTLLIIPMKWMEDAKKSIVDRIDRWKNTEYHAYCKENNIEPEKLPHEETDKPKTWANMISARLIGFASVIGIDAGLQIFNNKRHNQGKWNLDTAEWKLGSKIYDALPKSISENFVNFFSARKTSDLSGIQPQMREALGKTVGNEKSRMMFAEQGRIVQKELILLSIMSGLVYILAKIGLASSAMDKAGIKDKDAQHKAIDDMLPDVPFVPVTRGEVDLGATDKKIDPEKYKKAKLQEHGSSYAQKYANEQLQSANSQLYVGA